MRDVLRYGMESNGSNFVSTVFSMKVKVIRFANSLVTMGWTKSLTMTDLGKGTLLLPPGVTRVLSMMNLFYIVACIPTMDLLVQLRM